MKQINNRNIVDLDQHLQLLSIPSGKYRRLKCNVDVAFHEVYRRVSLGCCVHDSNGQFITTQTRLKKMKVFVLEGEPVTLLEAIRFVSNKV